MSAPLEIVWVDGAYVPSGAARVSALDRGLLVGDGLFETLLVRRGAAAMVERHLSRMGRAALALGLRIPVDAAGLHRISDGLVRRNEVPQEGGPDRALRLTVTSGVEEGGPPTVIALLRSFGPTLDRRRREGVELRRLRGLGRGPLGVHKHVGHLASVAGARRLRDETAGEGEWPREGLFVDRTGAVLEGLASNVLVIRDGVLRTPPLSQGVLDGTRRRLALELAPRLGLEVVEGRVDEGDLEAADEILITSTSLPVAAGVALDGRRLAGPGVQGPHFRALRRAMEAEVEASLEPSARGR